MISTVRVLSSGGPMRVELARWRGKLVVVKHLQASSAVLANRLGREAAVVTHLEHHPGEDQVLHAGAQHTQQASGKEGVAHAATLAPPR